MKFKFFLLKIFLVTCTVQPSFGMGWWTSSQSKPLERVELIDAIKKEIDTFLNDSPINKIERYRHLENRKPYGHKIELQVWEGDNGLSRITFIDKAAGWGETNILRDLCEKASSKCTYDYGIILSQEESKVLKEYIITAAQKAMRPDNIQEIRDKVFFNDFNFSIPVPFNVRIAQFLEYIRGR